MFFPLFVLALIISYVLIGAGIKFLDQLTDSPNHSQSHQGYFWLIFVGLVILVNIWIFYDIYTTILALGIVLGLVASNKVDNKYFFIFAIAILPSSILRIMGLALISFVLPPLIVVFFVSMLDEFLHSKTHKIQIPTLRWILAHRPLLKIAVVLLAVLGFLTVFHIIAFWGFDIAYDLVAYNYRTA